MLVDSLCALLSDSVVEWLSVVVVDVLSAVEAIGVFQVVFVRDDVAGAMDRMVIRIERDFDDAALREAAAEIRGVPKRTIYNTCLRKDEG